MLFTNPDASSPTGFRVDISEQVTRYLDPIFSSFCFLLKSLNHLDGFGVLSPVWFPANVAPDASGLPDATQPNIDDAIFCAVLEQADHPDYGTFWPLDVTYVEDLHLLQLRPHLPFAQNTTYACVATDRLVTKQGYCYETPEHLTAVLSGVPIVDGGDEDLARLERYRQRFAPYIRMFFDQYGLAPEQIRAITFFKTQWLSHDLVAAREQLEEMAVDDPPKVGGWTRLEMEQPNVDSVWEGAYETVDWQHDDKFVFDDLGDPVPTGRAKVTLRLTLPQPGAKGYDPPYPVILYAHGMGDDRTQATYVAETFAAQGFATAAIDWKYHGDRSVHLQDVPGWLEGTIRSLQFFNVLRPRKFRDNIRQGVADVIWAKHVIRGLDALDLSPAKAKGDGQPDLDTNRIFFAGMSLGSIHGGIVAAIEPDIDTYLLNTGAGDFRTIALEGDIGQMILRLVGWLDDRVPAAVQSNLLLLIDLVVPVLDAADPYAYGRYGLQQPLYESGPRDVNMLHQMAAYDGNLGGPGCAQMARGIGLTQLEPYVWRIDDLPLGGTPFQGPGSFQYDTDFHGFFKEPNPLFDPANYQAGVFFRTARDQKNATIIDPFQ